MKFTRTWAMPDHKTFNIGPVKKLIGRYYKKSLYSVDPFANTSKLATVTNDLNPEYKTTHCMDALEFLKTISTNSVDLLFYDPPYSLRQVSECYKSFGIEVTSETTQSSWRSKHIDEISRVMKSNGIVICFGWNSSGVGVVRGFEMIEVLLVPHGGSHNDTIVTVERKKPTLFD